MGRRRLIGRTRDGMNTKLHTVTVTIGRPIQFFLTRQSQCEEAGEASTAKTGSDVHFRRTANRFPGLRPALRLTGVFEFPKSQE